MQAVFGRADRSGVVLKHQLLRDCYVVALLKSLGEHGDVTEASSLQLCEQSLHHLEMHLVKRGRVFHDMHVQSNQTYVVIVPVRHQLVTLLGIVLTVVYCLWQNTELH